MRPEMAYGGGGVTVMEFEGRWNSGVPSDGEIWKFAESVPSVFLSAIQSAIGIVASSCPAPRAELFLMVLLDREHLIPLPTQKVLRTEIMIYPHLACDWKF